MENEYGLDYTALDEIIEEMTKTVEKSKEEIFHISEGSIKELDQLKRDLEHTKVKVKDYIQQGEKLEKEVQKSRKQLSLVSSQFNRYTEQDIRKVYEQTHRLQTDLAIMQQEEKVQREKRDDLERRIIRLGNTIEHAGNLGQKVSVVLNYLYDDFIHVNQLLKNAEEKQQFGLKIIEAQEMERKRLSREVHDGPAQMLANTLIRSELVDLSYRQGNREQALKEIKEMRQNLRLSLKEVRRIIYDLRPMALDDLGLFPTLRKHVAKQSEYHNVIIELKLLGDERRLESNYEIAIFRLAQEALQNTIKHAEATTIRIVIEILRDKITVIIRDDGVGFDTDAVYPESYGLVGMKERIEILKGRLTIDSRLHEGTTVRCIIPLVLD